MWHWWLLYPIVHLTCSGCSCILTNYLLIDYLKLKSGLDSSKNYTLYEAMHFNWCYQWDLFVLQGCVLEKGLTYIWIGMYKRRSPTVQIVTLAVSNNKKVKLLTLAFVSWHTTFARNCVVIILSDFGEHSSQHAQCALNLGEARIFHTLDDEAWTERPRELRFFFIWPGVILRAAVRYGGPHGVTMCDGIWAVQEKSFRASSTPNVL